MNLSLGSPLVDSLIRGLSLLHRLAVTAAAADNPSKHDRLYRALLSGWMTLTVIASAPPDMGRKAMASFVAVARRALDDTNARDAIDGVDAVLEAMELALDPRPHRLN